MIERKTLAVMVDGSVSSEKAFDLALIVYRNSQKFNLIKVIHIFDTDKTYLKDEYKPEFIEKHYKNRLVSQLPADKYEVVSKMKKTNSKRDAFN
jgi:nucleotide-binding universal stress UspA family protein